MDVFFAKKLDAFNNTQDALFNLKSLSEFNVFTNKGFSDYDLKIQPILPSTNIEDKLKKAWEYLIRGIASSLRQRKAWVVILYPPL